MVSGVNLKEPLIIGVDPGTTTATAIIDGYGNVLDVYSKRDITRAELIKYILEFGHSVIISCDVNVVPKSVEKIAAKLGCIVYSPDTSLALNEKRELTKDYYHSLKNDHEVDALSAAIKAWKHHRTLFSKVNDALKKIDKKELFAYAMKMILKEEGLNIEDAIRELNEKNEPFEIKEVSKEEAVQRDVINRLQKKLVEKQQDIDSLQKQNILLSKALNEARRERRLKESRVEIYTPKDYQELESSINYLKKFRRIENKGYYPVIEISKIDGDLLEHINDRIDLEGNVVLTNDKENLNVLNKFNVKCLLTFDELASENLEFPVVQIEKVSLESFDDIKTIKIDYIEKRLAEAKKTGLIGWLKSYRKRKD